METVKTERGTIAGGISVLMIFMTLCIAIYGLLALMTAENELSLNLKNRDAAADYYAADALAVTVISEIADAIAESGTPVPTVGTIHIQYGADSNTASFSVPIDEYRNLDVLISFAENGNSIWIDRYRVANSLDWQKQAEETITVITEFE